MPRNRRWIIGRIKVDQPAAQFGMLHRRHASQTPKGGLRKADGLFFDHCLSTAGDEPECRRRRCPHAGQLPDELQDAAATESPRIVQGTRLVRCRIGDVQAPQMHDGIGAAVRRRADFIQQTLQVARVERIQSE